MFPIPDHVRQCMSGRNMYKHVNVIGHDEQNRQKPNSVLVAISRRFKNLGCNRKERPVVAILRTNGNEKERIHGVNGTRRRMPDSFARRQSHVGLVHFHNWIISKRYGLCDAARDGARALPMRVAARVRITVSSISRGDRGRRRGGRSRGSRADRAVRPARRSCGRPPCPTNGSR